jgi:nucleolar protein 56
MPLKYLLYESSSGYALFERKESEQIAQMSPEVQAALGDYSKFRHMVDIKGFCPFTSAEDALSNINDVSEGILNETLKSFLETQGLAKSKEGKKSKFTLGVSDAKLGGSIKDEMRIECESNETVLELLRGIRLHIQHFLKGLEHGDLERSQVGLGHSYSRSKLKFNIHRVDNMIIQAIAILDQLDKDINTFCMRIKEWYCWHFPELPKIVPDIKLLVRVSYFVGQKKTLLEDEEKRAGLVEVVDGDEDLARTIVEAARSSMGADLGEVDMENVSNFSTRVMGLIAYREQLSTYLQEKMGAVAPNLTALVGEQVGARLISKAGSLTNLSKAPASTVQILGAEKALFRALKTDGNTPKYGLIYNSGFITRAPTKFKGRVSRYLANKCSIASRIDCFSDEPTDAFGKSMHAQVEERLEFFQSGKVPRKNVDVMHEVMESLQDAETPVEDKKEKKKRKKEKAAAEEETEEKPSKKRKKKAEAEEEAEEKPKKKKSKK